MNNTRSVYTLWRMHIYASARATSQPSPAVLPPLFRSPLYNAEACDGLVESGMGATGTPPSMDSRGRDPMSMRLPEHGINRLFLL